ncbi:MAG: lactonase family protein [Cyanosarcina radialis HA8281-LM2]|jgi:6-phosphogluconolactonase (cycloisomerase 2 family)|nr:lactonase family protein [Cyanosarcina radialis HA8281-LM2]
MLRAFSPKKFCGFTAVVFSLPLLAGSAWAVENTRGAVYTMTNATTGNKVLVYSRDDNGKLSHPQAFDTGGLGTGGGLGNQNALVLDRSNRCLYVVNAGSNEISTFIVRANGLSLVSKISSGGSRPVSITVDRDLLYVLNAGGGAGSTDNISGFKTSDLCRLSTLTNSTRPLSAGNTAPAQIEFTPDGKVLIVTEKATNKISTYRVLSDGLTAGPKVQSSVGTTPFGFAFGKRDRVFISEAAAGAPNASTVSSYRVKDNGELQVIKSSLPTTETAACWVVVSNDGRFAYVSNTGSQSISGIQVSFFGNLSLLTPGGRSGTTGAGTAPIDLALSNDGLNLYALDNQLGSIAVFGVNPVNGAISRRQILTGLPVGANGLAAR